VKVLLACQNDVLRGSIAAALLSGSHQIRVMSTTADDRLLATHADQLEWWVADGTAPQGWRDAAIGCEAAIVVDPSVTASGAAESTDRPMNPGAESASSVRRLILVTARASEADGAVDAGQQLAALASSLPAEWLHLRTSTVYGVTDDPLTLFLIMMRSLPALPIAGDAAVARPLWQADLAQAIAASLLLPPSEINRVIDLAGPEGITQGELYDRIASLIDRRPLRIPVPDFLAAHGARLAEALHLSAPFNLSHLAFGGGGALDSADNAGASALLQSFGVTPTTLEQGLRHLITGLPEVTPSEGAGTLEVKHFSAEIQGSRYDATELLRQFRSQFKQMMPIEIGVEPAAPQTQLNEGGVVTMALPGRGHVQVRVEEVAPHHVIVATLRGHVVAGIVRFSTRQAGSAVVFEVMTCDTAANAVDWLALTLGGARVQDANWLRVVQNVVTLSGGTAESTHSDGQKLSGEEAAEVRGWIRTIIARQQSEPPAVTGQTGAS
jgi:uncharacterized protein YbjT (DUF2867 family)